MAKKHWKSSGLFVLASTQPCIKIRDDEVANIDRIVLGGDIQGLAAWKRPKSWFVAVVLCPGDDTKALTDYVRAKGLEAARFHFYLHAKTPVTSLREWAAAGLPTDRVDEGVTDWKTLHHLLGLHFNIQIVNDCLAGATS